MALFSAPIGVERVQMIKGNGMGFDRIVQCKYVGMRGGITNEGKQLKVAVCDDIMPVACYYKEMVEAILRQLEVKGGVAVYTEAGELLSSQTGYEIVFLDIELSDSNGLQVAKKLRERKGHEKIIFMTNYNQYIQEAYKVQPFRYLYKSDPEEWVREAIIDALEENEERQGMLLEGDGQTRCIILDDILYVEALGDEIAIILEGKEKYIVRMTLKAIYGLLESRFIKCSRRVLINPRHIQAVEDASIILNGDVEIPMSCREKKSVKQKYREYIKKSVKW